MVSDLISDLIRYAVGGLILLIALFVIYVTLGVKTEFMGLFRCRKLHPKHKTRCALQSNGHLGVPHRDRRGRAWW